MRFRCFALVSAAAAVFGVMVLAPVSSSAQQKTAPPLTAWGAPDLTGVSGWSSEFVLAATTTTGSMRVTVDGATPGANRCREGSVFVSASRFGPF